MLRKRTRTTRNMAGMDAPEWLQPLSDREPCGPNLEYESEYLLLLAKARPKGDAQYGDFVDTPGGPNWADIERDCRHLLLRSRDITLLVLLLRCRTRNAQASGLLEGLIKLVESLERYPEHIHPQLLIDGEKDVAMRANALAALTDPEGALSDIREIDLSSSSAMRLGVRDVERALASPRHPDAASAEAVKRQLSDLYDGGNEALINLMEASIWVKRLQQWVQVNLPHDAPDLQALDNLLNLFARQSDAVMRNETPCLTREQIAEPESAECEPSPLSESNSCEREDAEADQRKTSMESSNMSRHTIDGRQGALQAIQEAREWFELAEPSSPVAVLLRQAEKLVGKRFSEVAQSIPADLLAQWERE